MAVPMEMAGEPSELLQALEMREIELCDSEDVSARGRNATEQMLLYFTVDRMEDARFLWKRCDLSVRAWPQLVAAWEVGKCLWQRANVPEGLRLLEQSDWDVTTRPFAKLATDRLRDREIKLISNVYSTITLANFSRALCYSDGDAIHLCGKLGWNYDPNAGMVSPSPLAMPLQQFDGFAHINNLTTIVTQLTT